MNEERRAADLLFMRSPSEWPNWPLLPIKRYPKGKPMECGLITEFESNIVIQAGLFDGSDVILKAPRLKYDSLEALVADGWMVD